MIAEFYPYTKNDIGTIIKYGNPVHSDNAEALLHAIRTRTGIDIVACYVNRASSNDGTDTGLAVTIYVCSAVVESVRQDPVFPSVFEAMFRSTSDIDKKILHLQVENFDELALCHLLSNCTKTVCKGMEQIYGLYVKVYVGYPPNDHLHPTHYIIFDSRDYLAQSVCATKYDEVRTEICTWLKSYDKWNVLDEASYRPICKIWADVSAEERFSFLREF